MPATVEILKNLFSKPLPGVKAQELMSASRRFTGVKKPDPETARDSSVFILLFQKNKKWNFPLIKRSEYNGVHSGQISLPGGKYEPADRDLIQTAYRETKEEIGIPPDKIIYIGTLTTLYIPNSNFNVTPHVGLITSPPRFLRNEREVEEIITVPVNVLLDTSGIRYFTREINNTVITAPYYPYQNHKIWGATAMILSEFAEVIRNSPLFTSHTNHYRTIPG